MFAVSVLADTVYMPVTVAADINEVERCNSRSSTAEAMLVSPAKICSQSAMLCRW
jgi:hypothetical protein